MSTTVTAEQILARSIQLATANVLNSGGPFGAMIVTRDGQSFDGVNRVTADQRSHRPCRGHGNPPGLQRAGHLRSQRCHPLHSCEPCPMCLASALWARIDRVMFAADRHDAASVGFDDAVFYEYFENQDRDSLMPVAKLELVDPAGAHTAGALQHLEHARIQDRLLGPVADMTILDQLPRGASGSIAPHRPAGIRRAQARRRRTLHWTVSSRSPGAAQPWPANSVADWSLSSPWRTS